VSGIVSALLTKTFRSSTFRLALICIAIFGAIVFALIGYVYWSTASYVRGQSDLAAFTASIELALAGGALLILVLAVAMGVA